MEELKKAVKSFKRKKHDKTSGKKAKNDTEENKGKFKVNNSEKDDILECPEDSKILPGSTKSSDVFYNDRRIQ